MPAESRENPLLKKGNSDAFFKEKYLTKNRETRRANEILKEALGFFAASRKK